MTFAMVAVALTFNDGFRDSWNIPDEVPPLVLRASRWIEGANPKLRVVEFRLWHSQESPPHSGMIFAEYLEALPSIWNIQIRIEVKP